MLAFAIGAVLGQITIEIIYPIYFPEISMTFGRIFTSFVIAMALVINVL